MRRKGSPKGPSDAGKGIMAHTIPVGVVVVYEIWFQVLWVVCVMRLAVSAMDMDSYRIEIRFVL